MTEDEIVAMVVILFVAGHVTTVNLIANGTFALLTHPAEAARFMMVVFPMCLMLVSFAVSLFVRLKQSPSIESADDV